MSFARSRRLSTLAAAGLGTVLSAGLAVNPAQAAETAATGIYSLDYSSVFTGQTITLTQKSAAEVGDSTPTITWGDGETETLYGSRATHTYATAKSYHVSVAEGDNTATFDGASDVTVKAVTGTYKLTATSAWIGLEVTQPVSLSLASVPAEADQVRIGWDYGDEDIVNPRTTKSVRHEFDTSGKHNVTVSFLNEAGESSSLSVGTVTVGLDFTDPTVKLILPKKYNRGASWKAVTGVAADRGAGVLKVAVVVSQIRGSKTYYWTGRKWVKTTKARALFVTPNAKGGWSVKVAGVKKGRLIIGAAAVDKVGNVSTGLGKAIKITS